MRALRLLLHLRLALTVLLFSAGARADIKVETGALNQAQFRVDVPDNWNGGLILYCHGYSPKPGAFDVKPGGAAALFTAQGFAVAQSGYASGGWAIEEAIQDTLALHRYFAGKYGAPKQTWVTGHSMGGFLTMALLEKFPHLFAGGMPICGPLASAAWFMERRVFDMRVVFDHYFPGALPPPDKVPADYAISPALNQKIENLITEGGAGGDAMRRYTGIKTNKELAGTLVFFTYILKDLQQRGGGNPFDNRNTIYDGTPDDNAVNDGVIRYAADPRAAEYLRTWYSATGRLSRPMLAIHTTYDPLVPPWTPNHYSILAAQAGSGEWFVQQYVKHEGHCAVQPAEMLRGFSQLREWESTGKRPSGGPLR